EPWQFFLARVRLAYGERLRRPRVMIDARVQFNAALEIFERLRARPWVDGPSAVTSPSRSQARYRDPCGRSRRAPVRPPGSARAQLAINAETLQQTTPRALFSCPPVEAVHELIGDVDGSSRHDLDSASITHRRFAWSDPRFVTTPLCARAFHKQSGIAAPKMY